MCFYPCTLSPSPSFWWTVPFQTWFSWWLCLFFDFSSFSHWGDFSSDLRYKKPHSSLFNSENSLQKQKYTISPTALERLIFFHQKEFLHLCGPAVSPVLLLHAGGQHSATGSSELQLWFRGFEQLSRTLLTRALRHLSFPQLGLKSKDKELLCKAAFRYFFFNANQTTQTYKNNNQEIHVWNQLIHFL